MSGGGGCGKGPGGDSWAAKADAGSAAAACRFAPVSMTAADGELRGFAHSNSAERRAGRPASAAAARAWTRRRLRTGAAETVRSMRMGGAGESRRTRRRAGDVGRAAGRVVPRRPRGGAGAAFVTKASSRVRPRNSRWRRSGNPGMMIDSTIERGAGAGPIAGRRRRAVIVGPKTEVASAPRGRRAAWEAGVCRRRIVATGAPGSGLAGGGGAAARITERRGGRNGIAGEGGASSSRNAGGRCRPLRRRGAGAAAAIGTAGAVRARTAGAIGARVRDTR